MSATGGLGIAGFLKHTNDSGGGGSWLRQWRKKGVGEATIWLHTRAPIVPCWSHSFKLEDEYEDKETGRSMPVLRFPRFVSPDAEVVHRSQFFRNEPNNTGPMQVPPDRDPFLLLREWLRFNADHIGLEDPIFKWNDEKNRSVIIWDRGALSGLVKRGKANFDAGLDTKLEYVYVVVDNDNVEAGPVLAREGKLLSQKIVEVIKQQQKQWGDQEGDPMQHPYAFLLVGKDTPSPMNRYSAFKAERAEFSDLVWEKISSDDFPDPTQYGRPMEGDMEKIRDAFEKAMQVDLPLDQIFSEDAEVRRDLVRPHGATRPAPRESKRSQQQPVDASRKPAPPSRTNGSNGAPVNGAAAAAPASAKPAPAAVEPQRRRKKVEPPPEPEPEPEPQGEMIPCDECKKEMLATDTKCPHCGTEYEPIEDETQKPAPAPVPATSKPKPGAATSAKPKPSAGAAPAESSKPAPAAAGGGGANQTCWSCGQGLGGAQICPSCGIDQGDEIPFIINEIEHGWDFPGIGERWHAKETARRVI